MMQRITALNPETTEGKSKELFESVKKKLGMVPNLMRTMGNSPATLNGYLSFSNALSQSAIGGKLSELIALAVANENGCEYCTTAHTFIAANLLKIDHQAIAQARAGISYDNKIQLALNFSRELIKTKGKVSDESIQSLKDIGFTEGEITEIIAHTALNIFTNFINNSGQVKVDFPAVELNEIVEV